MAVLLEQDSMGFVVLAAGAELPKKKSGGWLTIYFGTIEDYLEPHPAEDQDACGFCRDESASLSPDDSKSPLILRAT